MAATNSHVQDETLYLVLSSSSKAWDLQVALRKFLCCLENQKIRTAAESEVEYPCKTGLGVCLPLDLWVSKTAFSEIGK